MITQTKTHFFHIAKYLGVTKLPRTSIINKKRLIQLAKSGVNRPSQKTKLGRALSEYTKKSSKTCDREFNNLKRKLRPDWFFSQTQVVNQKKQKLLKMAKNGQKRPSADKTKLGQDLSNYTRKSSFVYDPKFDRLIRKTQPDWFQN